MPGAAYLCDADGRITFFNRHAAELWGREPELDDPRDRFCGSHRLSRPDGSPMLHEESWTALALREDRSYSRREVVVHRPDGEQRNVLAHVNPLHDASGKLVGAVSLLFDITPEMTAVTRARRTNAELREEVARQAAGLNILHDVTVAANQSTTVDQAIYVSIKRICETNHWILGHAWRLDDLDPDFFVSTGVWYVAASNAPSDDLVRGLQQATAAARIPVDGSFLGQVSRTAAPIWCDDTRGFKGWKRANPARFGFTSAVAFPVWVESSVVAVLEFFSDRPIRRDARFMEIMPDVGLQLGHVFARKRLEKAIADATAEQEQRISRQLHDGVSQLLTGAGMLCESLRQALQSESSPHGELASKLVGYVRQAQEQVRNVGRGLTPVELDANGLMKALEQLARRVQEVHNVPCLFLYASEIPVEDNQVATQLYYIANEALHNAARHAAPKSLTMRLKKSRNTISLVVTDDGMGMSPGAKTGMGLAIMRYRAGLIRAKLEIASRPGAGTKLVCRVPVST